MKNKRISQKNTDLIIEVLNEKLEDLLALREELETREESFTDVEKRKALVQGIIDLTHQIQALRVVIELFSKEQ